MPKVFSLAPFSRFVSIRFATAVCLLNVLHVVASAQSDCCPGDTHKEREPLGFDLFSSWISPWEHSDYSAAGIPFVHPITLEPPYIDRSLIVDFGILRGYGNNELGIAAELEWGFTRRFAMAVEVPFSFLEPDSGNSTQGVGDFSLAGRFLLIETSHFLLSAQVEASFPTGRRSVGLSAEEVILEPSLLAWVNLGNGFSLNTQAGFERGVESDATEIFYSAALAWTAPTRKASPSSAETNDGKTSHGKQTVHHHEHPSRAGLLSLLVEFNGRTVTRSQDKEEEGLTTGEAVLGAVYSLTDNFDVRAGYLVPVMDPKELRDAWLFGATLHF